MTIMMKQNGPPDSAVFLKIIPHIFVFLWIIYLGTMIWLHAARSIQPPTNDPLTYMYKARNFWTTVYQKKWINPLNIEPTNRPPGTVLVSYPFGLSLNFKGFQFRSIYLPVLCTVFAVYITIGWPKRHSEGWQLAAIAILFSSMPLFYSFDYNEFNPKPFCWGLVDTFQAGVAGMATAGIINSLKKRSLPWLICGTLSGAFTLFIKPSGLMVMGILSIIWLIVICMQYIGSIKNGQSNSGLHFYTIIGGMLTLLVYGAVSLLCFSSKYFSTQNFDYAQKALRVMKNVLKSSSSHILYLLYSSAGIVFMLWILGISILMITNLFLFKKLKYHLTSTTKGLLLSVPVIWILGVFYWLVVQAGGNQVRYFYPFLLMGGICLIPAASEILSKSRPWFRGLLNLLCFVSAINLATLLALDSPSIKWQQFTGVNVTVGQDQEEINQAYRFLDELKKRNQFKKLYFFLSGALSDNFVNVGVYEAFKNPGLPVFIPVTSSDWTQGFLIRVNQILDSDVILIRKFSDSNPDTFFGQKLDTYLSESIAFQSWLNRLNRKEGIEIISDGNVLRLIEIIDKKAFSKALASFLSTRTWRPEFIAANSLINQ